MEALQTLLDPLCNAARLNVGLIDIGYRSALVNGEFELIAAGAIFTDGDGHIVETNRPAEHILRIGDGLTIRDGRICARRSFETAKLTHLIARAVSPSDGVPSAGCILVARDDDRPAYVVRVVPVGAGIAGNDLTMAMILVSAPDEKRISEQELAELYGLSPAESRIAIALTRGKRLGDLAGEFGVQITTLRTQLSSILSKCEVERQSDLIRLILSIPIAPGG
jgi:DNA-binding CsgD family transcriptional regulator